VPLAAIGLGFSLSLFVLLLLAGTAGPEARTAAAVIAFLALAAALAVDAVLLGVQLRAIKAFCRLCLLTYAINPPRLVLVQPPSPRPVVIREGLAGATGRMAFAGWTLATMAMAAAVLSASVALRYRERLHAGTILGLPAAAPAPAARLAPAPAGSEAQRYQEE